MLLENVYQKLGLADDCLIRLSDPNWKDRVSFPSRVFRLLETNDLLKQMDAFFCFDNKPLILFFKEPANKQALHKAIWNFNESPIAVIMENESVEVFNGFSMDEDDKLLERIGGEGILGDFSYFELVTGKTWLKYREELSHKNRVDYKLLENIDATQKKLIDLGLTQKVANALIGKIIFIRYLIDRKVQLHFQDIPKFWSNEDLCDLLSNKERYIQFVKYLEDSEKGFNGDLFRITPAEYVAIPQQALDVIIKLLKGIEIRTGQLSLFKLYDFSILPVEFISCVYEKFIGKENQNNEGAYYTPTFLVDYIIQHSIGKHFESTHNYDCKVLDPACGSGIFLVESLRRIIDKFIIENAISEEQRNTDTFRNQLRQLVRDNIYGIDKDESAVQVAIFSIYLTLLDYQNPADIGNFKFPNLLGTNLICSDAFDTSNEHLRRLSEREIQFDYIIGNPPWMRGRIARDAEGKVITPTYVRYLHETGQLSIVGNKELAQAFVLRSMDFATANTQMALVLTSKVLYNLQSGSFRRHILETTYIDQVFELAPVRKEIFISSNDSAIAPACVLFFRKANGEDTNAHLIEHISLKPSRFFSQFKVLTLTRNDIQYVKQGLLKTDDWLWKTLVYGSYLDYLLIKRLKKRQSLSDFLTTNEMLYGQGITIGGGDKNNTDCLTGKPLLEAKNIKQYQIIDPTQSWEGELVHRTRDFNLYKAPLLLTTKGTQTDLRAEAAICLSDVVYKDAVTGIRSQNVGVLRNIEGLLNSSLFAYLNINTFSSSGIEREQALIQEKLSMPYQRITCIRKIMQLEALLQEAQQSTMVKDELTKEIAKLKREIDAVILKNYNCSSVELDLIDYALTVSIPMAVKPVGYENLFNPLKNRDAMLKQYARVFVDRFTKAFKRVGKQFYVEIIHTPEVIGMLFKVRNEEVAANKQISFVEKGISSAALSALIGLSSTKTTEQLFVQKDIRGFEPDYFYIIKPNEKRLWHRAIAHLDVNEFAEAMLKAGGE